jgi:hypothetical protein
MDPGLRRDDNPGSVSATMNAEQAFKAMLVFLDAYDQRTSRTAEFGDVLGDIQLNKTDGRPADPAAWDDWLAAVDAVCREAKAEAKK